MQDEPVSYALNHKKFIGIESDFVWDMNSVVLSTFDSIVSCSPIIS